jgi:hypothetical protein
MPNLSRSERETGILWNDEDASATVWTVSPSIRDKLTRKLGSPAVLDPNGSWSWTIPKSWVRITKRRKLSPEAAAAGAARLLKARQDRA